MAFVAARVGPQTTCLFRSAVSGAKLRLRRMEFSVLAQVGPQLGAMHGKARTRAELTQQVPSLTVRELPLDDCACQIPTQRFAVDRGVVVALKRFRKFADRAVRLPQPLLSGQTPA